jgi:hypothetical protein
MAPDHLVVWTIPSVAALTAPPARLPAATLMIVPASPTSIKSLVSDALGTTSQSALTQ